MFVTTALARTLIIPVASASHQLPHNPLFLLCIGVDDLLLHQTKLLV